MGLQGPVKGIFFDLGWTLIAPQSGDWMFSAFAQGAFPPGKLAALPQERVVAARKAGMEYLDTHHLLSTMEEEYALFQQYYTKMAEALPERGVSGQDIRAVAEDKVYNKGNYTIFPDALPTLKALRGRYKLGVISDTWPSIVPVLEDFGLLPYFDCITFSYELGVYKPHPRMYADALSKMGLPPEQAVFVDDFTGNLEGAQRAGIQPVLIQAKPGPDDTQEMVKVGRVSGLLEVLPR